MENENDLLKERVQLLTAENGEVKRNLGEQKDKVKYLEEKLSEHSARLTVVESALAETPEKERVEQFANEIVALKDSQQEIESRIHDLQTRPNHTPTPQLGTAFY